MGPTHRRTPESVLDLMEIPALDQRLRRCCINVSKVSSLAELKTFVAGGGLDMVDGIGARIAEALGLLNTDWNLYGPLEFRQRHRD